MKKDDYVLKSTRQDIVNAINKTGVCSGEEANDAVKIILDACPKELYKNIDEIINKIPLTPISFEIKTSGGVFTETISSICNLFYNDLPQIIIFLGVCKEINGKSGFAWLHDLCQYKKERLYNARKLCTDSKK